MNTIYYYYRTSHFPPLLSPFCPGPALPESRTRLNPRYCLGSAFLRNESRCPFLTTFSDCYISSTTEFISRLYPNIHRMTFFLPIFCPKC